MSRTGRMAGNHDWDTQFLTEVMDNDGRRSCSGNTIAATHASGLIDQQAYSEIDRFSREACVAEDPSIIAMESVLVKPLAHQESSLLTALALVPKDCTNASLKAFGEHQEIWSNLVVPIDQILIHASHAIDGHMDVPVSVAI